MFAYADILGLVLIVGLVGCLPIWPQSKKWGYYPIGVASAVMLILVVFFDKYLW
jgi:bacteriorhodopsin